MANPIMKLEERNAEQERVINQGEVMTINGTLQITAFMGLMLMMSAAFVWQKFAMGHTDFGMMLMSIGGIVGFITALIVAFARVTALVPVYAICEGLLLGGLSATFESSYPGIVAQALAGTLAAFFSMLLLYRAGMIKCTDKFRMVIFNCALAIFLIYLTQIILGIFNFTIPHIFSNSPIGIGFSIFTVSIATLYLIIDFDNIERFAGNVDKHLEWYFGFSLLVTIIWMYLEILHLLMKLQSRN